MASHTVPAAEVVRKYCKSCRRSPLIEKFSISPATSLRYATCDKCRAKTYRSRERNRDQYLASKRASYQKHRTKRVADAKSYADQNRDAINERKREWRAQNPDRVKQDSLRYYWENPDRRRAQTKQWRLRNLDKVAEIHSRNRAKLKSATIGDTVAIQSFYRTVRTATFIPCYWCNKNTRRGSRHVDHIVPIARGGPHSIENLCCSCPTCNMRKSDKMPEEFSQQRQMFLSD